MVGTRLRVTGTVQGVGFRPFVYRHAVELGLAGFVLNDSNGVLIEVSGPPEQIAELERRILEHPPPLARVADVATESVERSVDQWCAVSGIQDRPDRTSVVRCHRSRAPRRHTA